MSTDVYHGQLWLRRWCCVTLSGNWKCSEKPCKRNSSTVVKYLNAGPNSTAKPCWISRNQARPETSNTFLKLMSLIHFPLPEGLQNNEDRLGLGKSVQISRFDLLENRPNWATQNAGISSKTCSVGKSNGKTWFLVSTHARQIHHFSWLNSQGSRFGFVVC